MALLDRRSRAPADCSAASVILDNASFTRAFSRRYGVAPTRYRAHRLAA
jgi:AraC-like DNA-binding protein